MSELSAMNDFDFFHFPHFCLRNLHRFGCVHVACEGAERGEPPESHLEDQQDRELYDQLCLLVEVSLSFSATGFVRIYFLWRPFQCPESTLHHQPQG